MSILWAISIQVGNTSTYLEKASLKISKYFYIPTVGWILVKSLFSESTRMLASKYWAEGEIYSVLAALFGIIHSAQARGVFFSLFFFKRMVGFHLSNYMDHGLYRHINSERERKETFSFPSGSARENFPPSPGVLRAGTEKECSPG